MCSPNVSILQLCLTVIRITRLWTYHRLPVCDGCVCVAETHPGDLRTIPVPIEIDEPSDRIQGATFLG